MGVHVIYVSNCHLYIGIIIFPYIDNNLQFTIKKKTNKKQHIKKVRPPINLTNYVLKEYEDIDQYDPTWSKFIQYQIKSIIKLSVKQAHQTLTNSLTSMRILTNMTDMQYHLS